MNLIKGKRKAMKEMLTTKNDTFFPILCEAPMSFLDNNNGGGIDHLLNGLSFPDLDFDFNLFDFINID